MTRVRTAVDGGSFECEGTPNLISSRASYYTILILHVPFGDRSIVPFI